MESQKKNAKSAINNSLSDTESNIQFSDILNLKEIQNLQDLFSEATGVASIITFPDGTPITNPSNFCSLCKNIIRKTPKGHDYCLQSFSLVGRYNPSGAIIWPCMCGALWGAGARISVGGKHIANWIIGQVKNEIYNEQKVLDFANEIGADKEYFLKELKDVPVMPLEKFTKLANMLFAFANEISEKAYKNLQLKNQISENLKVTEALQDYKNWHQAVLNSLPDSILITDMEGRIHTVYPFGTLLGYKSEVEVAGRLITDFIYPEDRELALKNLNLLIHGSLPVFSEYRVQHTDGSLLEIEVKGKIIRDKKGIPNEMLFVLRDITRKKA